MSQINVFKLGHVFKALHKAVHISNEPIAPVLPEDLIYRFAQKLDFGDDTERIAETACKLVQRMQLDWIIMGRRPSGICGACLILAARMHNYRRTVKEVVYIVKVTTATIQKRLDEFKYTASSELTVEEFLQNDFLESHHDPPSFYQKTEEYLKNKKTRKRKQVLQLGEDEEDEGAQNMPLESRAPSEAAAELTPELEALPNISYPRDKDGFVIPPLPGSQEIPIDPSLLKESAAYDDDEEEDLENLAKTLGDANPEGSKGPSPKADSGDSNSGDSRLPSLTIDSEWQEDEDALENEIMQSINDPHTVEHAKAFTTGEQRARIIALIEQSNNPQKEVSMDVHVGEDEFADDPEVNHCILSESEAALKEKIWVNDNKDWLRLQQEKVFKKKMAALGPPKATRKRKKRARIGEGQLEAANSPAEAAVAAMKERTWSKKINYDAITSLFDNSSRMGSAATSRVTSRAGSVAPSEGGSDVAGLSSVAGSDVGNTLLGEEEIDDAVDEDGDDYEDDWQEV
jgi:transcription factor IIIB subunit 2